MYVSAATDVIVDLLGTAGGAGFRYQAATPVRLLDTRDGTGGWNGRPAAIQVLDLPSVPGAAALALTVATVAPDGDGFTTVYPCGAERPVASNLKRRRGRRRRPTRWSWRRRRAWWLSAGPTRSSTCPGWWLP